MVGFSDDIRLLVRNACDDVLDAFLETNEIKAEHRMTFMEKGKIISSTFFNPKQSKKKDKNN